MNAISTTIQIHEWGGTDTLDKTLASKMKKHIGFVLRYLNEFSL